MSNLIFKFNGSLLGLSLILMLILANAAFSQEKAGLLSGKVTDEQGNIVVAAEIFLTGKNGKTQKVSSLNNGNFVFSNVSPGNYVLEVKTKDFDLFRDENILIESGKTVNFDVQLKIKPITELVKIESEIGAKADPSNTSDLKLSEKDVEEQLPDDPDALANALKAMAPSGPGEPQIFVDGFESSKPPPKQTIREIRISSNTFTAEDDRPSGARIQIFTKSGFDKLQGGVFFNWSNDKLNSRNPFANERPPYAYRQYGINLGGKLVPKKVSFFTSFQKLDEDQSGIVTARILDSAFNFVSLNSSFTVPRRDISASARIDWQINEKNSLNTRYSFNRASINNIGIGELTLAERGYGLRMTGHLFQLSETMVINPQTVNELRFQFINTDTKKIDNNPNISINVQESFLGGGAGQGRAFNRDNRFELQNYITTNFSKHLLRFGVRLRGIQIKDTAPTNFNGSYTFTGGLAPLLDNNNEIVLDSNGQPVNIQITSLERYRRTLLLRSLGFSPAAIRLRGGGATQFSVSRGNPQADVNQFEFGGFIQEEWRIKPTLNIYLGLRYENQNNIGDHSNFAPRIAFAWVPKIGKEQNTTIRGGIGLYYNRFETPYLLQSRRFDGIQQERFITSVPSLVDSFPNLPSSEQLSGFLSQQSVTRLADNTQAGRTVVSLLGLEQKLSPNSMVTVGFSYYRARHNLRERNINAPLPGTYIVGQNGSGIRPFGNVGNIFLIESSNDYFQNQFYINYRNQINPNISLFINYLLSDTKDGGAIGSFPADSYSLESEWGRASSFSIRHRLYLNGRFQIPKINLMISPQIVVFSQRPFNITTGIDTNGDQIFLERPAYATTASGVNIYNTAFGSFNINPSAGQEIIPRNIGRGPAFFSFNTSVSRTFALGKSIKTDRGSDRPYRLTLSAQIQNLFNNVNLATPVGNLSSPLFGLSTSTVGPYGFENGSSAYNRRIEAQLRFTF
ncbi:MAG: carboxypeptidase regulatory-like domain-containing protein [Pyrinomonadaceae bacterium]|nr:carboxypeptidase regulatory-like domain-containing protein [Pyrinomonadaceae bacterium]